MFKVVPDQLTVSDGWVRCGHCHGVFDASAHFQAMAEPEVLEAPETEVNEPHFSVPEFIAEEDSKNFVLPMAATSFPPAVDHVSLNVIHESTKALEGQVQHSGPPAQPEVSAATRATANSHIDDSSVSAPLSSYLSAPEAADFPFQDDHGRSQDAADRRTLYGSAASNKLLHSLKTDAAQRPAPLEMAFVQTAKHREKSKGPLDRVIAVLIALLFLGALALQVLFHAHDALASRYPALLPVLEGMCQKMDCQINPPPVIEAIKIDSSSFTQTGPDAYRLNVVLKNTRSAVVAMPALEVTLMGSKNEVLIRKVLLPSAFGAASNRLEQAIPFTGGLTLLVSQPSMPAQLSQAASSVEAVTAGVPPAAEVQSTSVPITGYRLFAFYP